MDPITLAREALGAVGILAATDEQIDRCLALAALLDRDYAAAAAIVADPRARRTWRIDLGAFDPGDAGRSITIAGRVFRLAWGPPPPAAPGEVPVNMGAGTRHFCLGSAIMDAGLSVFVRTDDPLVLLCSNAPFVVTTDAPSVIVEE